MLDRFDIAKSGAVALTFKEDGIRVDTVAGERGEVSVGIGIGVGPGRPASRPRYDARTADMIVQRAFREVLDRSPDPEGLRTYRQRLMYEGWTERVQAMAT